MALSPVVFPYLVGGILQQMLPVEVELEGDFSPHR